MSREMTKMDKTRQYPEHLNLSPRFKKTPENSPDGRSESTIGDQSVRRDGMAFINNFIMKQRVTRVSREEKERERETLTFDLCVFFMT